MVLQVCCSINNERLNSKQKNSKQKTVNKLRYHSAECSPFYRCLFYTFTVLTSYLRISIHYVNDLKLSLHNGILFFLFHKETLRFLLFHFCSGTPIAIFSGVIGSSRTQIPVALATACASAGDGVLITISPIDFAPKGPDFS